SHHPSNVWMVLVLTVELLRTALGWELTCSDERGMWGPWYMSWFTPGAPNLCTLTLSSFQSWDAELEAFAQAYAEKCIWDHNKDRGHRGENLFAMAPILDLEFAVEDWNGEEKYYNLSASTCVSGQMCGHYTQVVWASTHRIGCGAKFCDKIDGIEAEGMHLLVCNYYPPGNMKGRKPYKEGPSCSQCPEGRVCVNSLCESTAAPVTTQASPSTPTTAMPKPTATAKPAPITTASTTAKPAPITPVPATTTAKPAPTTAKPVPITPGPSTTTAKPAPITPVPSTTTTKPATTTPGPSTTTTKPAPTTTKPAPTTPVPSTTTAKPAPTTTKPAPTTPVPSTTTAKPAPTTAKPAPTTTKPAPTTPVPSTTTTKPATTPPVPSTTTTKPATTPPVPSTTTTKPATTTPVPST
uniref:Uncharacterized protein n=1 Tax=Melopsittacus undulatus TaxID=13146 RepID=A0A8V5GGP1_MELUD